jgi:nucleoside-diphosphate-sugar epimerase
MAKLLLIGGTGFFGKSILSLFISGGLKKYKIDKIIILARNIDDFLNSHSELYCQDVEFVKGDIANISILPNADYIIHAAASTNLSDYHLSNYKNLEKSIIHFCRLAQLNNSKSKYLYCSSGAVYGKNLSQNKIKEIDLFQDDLSQLSEEQRFYCLSKRFAEKEIINLGKLGLKVSIARCFAFSGKYLPR